MASKIRFICYNFQYIISKTMRARLLQQLTPDHELLLFLSSYLRDVILIVSDLKGLVYQLIGIEPPPKKKATVSSDIHSVLHACNVGYEDLRRVETLLRGHVKGKSNSLLPRDSPYSSRVTVQNPSKSRFIKDPSHLGLNQPSPKLQPTQDYQQYTQQPAENLQEVITRRPTESHAHYLDPRQQPRVSEPSRVQRRIGASRSQGQLTRASPPSESAGSGCSKSPLVLIEKIRNQLGLLGRP